MTQTTTDSIANTKARAQAVDCPFCGASAGQPCRTRNCGREQDWPHSRREGYRESSGLLLLMFGPPFRLSRGRAELLPAVRQNRNIFPIWARTVPSRLWLAIRTQAIV
jgi:hypothetical protein